MAALFMAACLLAAPQAALADGLDPGLVERLRFDLFFGPLAVGEAELAVFALDDPMGELRHAVFTARSYALVDAVLKVRDRAESLYDPGSGRVLWYLKTQIRDGRTVTRQTRFDPRGTKASQIEGAATVASVKPPLATLDPLAALLRLRGLALAPGATHRASVTDGKNLSLAVIETGEPQDVRVPAGVFSTLPVTVDMGAVEPPIRTAGTGRFTVYVEPGRGNLPVKIKTTVDMGPFSGTLVAVLTGVEAPDPR